MPANIWSEREFLESHPKARAHEWGKTKLTIKEIEAILIAMGICGDSEVGNLSCFCRDTEYIYIHTMSCTCVAVK